MNSMLLHLKRTLFLKLLTFTLTGLLTFPSAEVLAQCTSITNFTTIGGYNGNCYYLGPISFDYAHATFLAAAAGGHLVTITSQAEQDFVFAGSDPTIDSWIGLDEEPSSYVWVTGEPLTYTNWEGLPEFSIGTNVQIRRNTGFWIETTAAAKFFLEIENALPVELIDFQVSLLKESNEALITWETASEDNNEGYEIQRSLDGRNWEMLDFVEGNGTTITSTTYQYFDHTPSKGVNYYRLKQIDYDGAFNYSEVKSVEIFSNLNSIVKLYPNPVRKGKVTLELAAEPTGSETANLFDVAGKLIRVFPLTNIQNELDIAFLNKGIYLLEGTNGAFHWVERLVVE